MSDIPPHEIAILDQRYAHTIGELRAFTRKVVTEYGNNTDALIEISSEIFLQAKSSDGDYGLIALAGLLAGMLLAELEPNDIRID
jgi:hypothetical protein